MDAPNTDESVGDYLFRMAYGEPSRGFCACGHRFEARELETKVHAADFPGSAYRRVTGHCPECSSLYLSLTVPCEILDALETS